MLKAHTLNDQICAHFNNAAHGMEVPANARLLFCNGQVGARPDGIVPEEPLEQVEVIFERIEVILAAASMTFNDIVKFTVYVTDASIFENYYHVSERILAGHKPPTILLIVDSFPRQGVEVEVEVIAAKVDKP